MTLAGPAGRLNVSEQYLWRLLDNGAFKAVGAHGEPRLRLADVLPYKAEDDQRCPVGLLDLVCLMEELGLYDAEYLAAGLVLGATGVEVEAPLFSDDECAWRLDAPVHALVRSCLMRQVSVSELRAQLSTLLDAVVAGEELIITRYGKPVARLTPVTAARFLDRADLRGSMPAMRDSAQQFVRDLRDDERY